MEVIRFFDYRSGPIFICLVTFTLIVAYQWAGDDVVKIYLIGDSTVANYAENYDEGKDYYKTRYPLTGWGQEFQQLFSSSERKQIGIIAADSVIVDNRARGGRSSRTFFQEGRWRRVYEELEPDDLVLIQFGHNDAAKNKPERYVDVEGFKEFLRFYVHQSREKGAVPVILTPVNRNYPWEGGQLKNAHGEYPQAAKEIADEMNVYLIDLTQLSIDLFTRKGKKYVTEVYFMNLPTGEYAAYPNGQEDNTHFQPEGARAVAKLVFEALRDLRN